MIGGSGGIAAGLTLDLGGDGCNAGDVDVGNSGTSQGARVGFSVSDSLAGSPESDMPDETPERSGSSSFTASVDVGIGRTGGMAAMVDITTDGLICTSGADADGVLAQSVGGGGRGTSVVQASSDDGAALEDSGGSDGSSEHGDG